MICIRSLELSILSLAGCSGSYRGLRRLQQLQTVWEEKLPGSWGERKGSGSRTRCLYALVPSFAA